MDFNLDTDQEILRDSVRKFVESEIKPVAGELDKEEKCSYDTMKKMAEESGKEVHLVDGVQVVPAGVLRIMELQEQGYTYIRP